MRPRLVPIAKRHLRAQPRLRWDAKPMGRQHRPRGTRAAAANQQPAVGTAARQAEDGGSAYCTPHPATVTAQLCCRRLSPARRCAAERGCDRGRGGAGRTGLSEGAPASLLAPRRAVLPAGRGRQAQLRAHAAARAGQLEHLGDLLVRRARLLLGPLGKGSGALLREDSQLRGGPRRRHAAHSALQVPAAEAGAQLAAVDDDRAGAPVLHGPGLLQDRDRPRDRQPRPAHH